MKNRETFNFYRSFYDAGKMLTDNERLAFYDAVLQASFEKTPPIVEGLAGIVFTAIKPVLDNQTTNYLNGKKGGRPSKNNPPLPKEKSYKEKEKEKDKENKKDKDTLAIKIAEKLQSVSNVINRSAFDEWIAYKKYKTIAPITKTINFLNNYSFDIQQQIVDTSIMNNYKGLFEPKQQKQPQQSFKEQDRQRTNEIADVVLNQGVNPFNPENYQQQEEFTDVQLTN